MGQFVLLLMHSVNQLDLISLLLVSHLLVTEGCLLPIHPFIMLTFIISFSLHLHLRIALSSLSLPPAGVCDQRRWICQSANTDFKLSPLLLTFPPSLIHFPCSLHPLFSLVESDLYLYQCGNQAARLIGRKSAFHGVNSLPLSHHHHLLSLFLLLHLSPSTSIIIPPPLSPPVSLHHDFLLFLSAPVTD